MKKEITLCGRCCNYELQRKKVKNINLHVKADGSIVISAPRYVSSQRIENFIKLNEVKVCAILDRLISERENTPMPEKFRSGEEFCYLGEIKKLQVSKAAKGSAELIGNTLYLQLQNYENPESVRKAFEKWLKEETKAAVTGICREYYPAFCPPLKEFPEIRFRKMRSRWGSCTPKKNLLCFNSCLICVPQACIEYVAAHEFSHFLYADHSSKFYRALGDFMPDHRERERRLRAFTQIPKQLAD